MSRVLAAVTLLVLVAGCSSSSSGGPVALSPVSAAPTGSPPVPSGVPTPTVTAEATPSAAVSGSPGPGVSSSGADDAAEAEAFARSWYAAVNAAYASLDSRTLRSMAASECLSCARLADSLDRSAAAGQKYQGGTVTIRSAASPPVEEGTASVLVDYRAEALRVFDVNGTVTDQVPAVPKTTVEMTLRLVSGKWRVREIERIEA